MVSRSLCPLAVCTRQIRGGGGPGSGGGRGGAGAGAQEEVEEEEKKELERRPEERREAATEGGRGRPLIFHAQ